MSYPKIRKSPTKADPEQFTKEANRLEAERNKWYRLAEETSDGVKKRDCWERGDYAAAGAARNRAYTRAYGEVE